MHGLSHPPIGSNRQFSKRRNAKEGHGRKQNRDPLSWDDLEKLLSTADVVDSSLIMLGLNCGFGNSDIGTLRLNDVDLEAGTVSHPRPKTGVERDFNLWPETVQILKAYLKKHRGKPIDEDASDLFFVNRRGRAFVLQVLKDGGKSRRGSSRQLTTASSVAFYACSRRLRGESSATVAQLAGFFFFPTPLFSVTINTFASLRRVNAKSKASAALYPNSHSLRLSPPLIESLISR